MPISTESLQEALDQATAHGSAAAGARALGIPTTTLKDRLDIAKRRGLTAQVQRLLGENAGVPAGYKLKGTSTLYDEDGKPKLQWVKTDASIERLQAMQRAAFAALCADLKPTPAVKAPKARDKDLATLYTMTDCHVGMLAWDKETGENWDLKIAEACLSNTFLSMIEAAPASEIGIVNQLGDFLHIDSLTPMTPTGHNVLDADSRYQKMVEVAVRILRRIISAALVKHNRVQVYMAEGNHDPAGSVWLRIMFSQLYGDNPRVSVEKSPNPYTCFQHGHTFLGFHHGHLKKPASLPLLFAAQFSEVWGKTQHRYIHTGHLHNVEEKEHAGVKTIQHPTIAAPDAYAARYGFLSKRQATSMTYHVKDGEVARAIFIPQERK